MRMSGGSEELERFHALHSAFVSGDLEAIRAALGNPPEFPNTSLPSPCGFGPAEPCLGYALHHAPLSLVQALLQLGADPNYPADNGFPSLFAAISSNHKDKHEQLRLLLEHGVDVEQRGINDYTALHYAACNDDPVAVEILLEYGADPDAHTGIDDHATPLEEAERFGHLMIFTQGV
jgi:hypothetical protein